ncbi:MULTISPECIES: PGPGW domain-containing protein [unclassified Thalassotalea]|uniref:PGPGW domain-containing protein n=1 Tax=unclassified Thalassotalea TaxID=2614972 RepID=UPI001081DCEE|nr:MULTISPECIES: PGPGW domain-containing protein [unclassified Thalassotalea]NMP15199.1 tellurium resistance protein TerC [Thalassotalea sp. Y01]QBY03758.1 tellurium resistance protein TerC [Thalassotalea sp. HSM 43]
METLKLHAKTVLGAICLFIGILFIVLPGPAILFIPLGLVLLSAQFPVAKVYLRKYQRYSRKAANKTDDMIKAGRYHWRNRKMRA